MKRAQARTSTAAIIVAGDDTQAGDVVSGINTKQCIERTHDGGKRYESISRRGPYPPDGSSSRVPRDIRLAGFLWGVLVRAGSCNIRAADDNEVIKIVINWRNRNDQQRIRADDPPSRVRPGNTVNARI